MSKTFLRFFGFYKSHNLLDIVFQIGHLPEVDIKNIGDTFDASRKAVMQRVASGVDNFLTDPTIAINVTGANGGAEAWFATVSTISTTWTKFDNLSS